MNHSEFLEWIYDVIADNRIFITAKSWNLLGDKLFNPLRRIKATEDKLDRITK